MKQPIRYTERLVILQEKSQKKALEKEAKKEKCSLAELCRGIFSQHLEG
jgi:hypothetical protein